MFTSFNHSLIDHTFLNLTILPSPMRLNFDESEEIIEANLNFTWNVTYYNDDILDILIIYEEPF